MIRGYDISEPFLDAESAPKESRLDGPAKVVVAIDTKDLEDMVIVGINANDRPGKKIVLNGKFSVFID